MAASFDCAKASTKHEKMICDNPELNKADEEMGELYFFSLKTFKEDAKEIKIAQKEFNKKYRKCKVLEKCLSVTKQRVDKLSERLGGKYCSMGDSCEPTGDRKVDGKIEACFQNWYKKTWEAVTEDMIRNGEIKSENDIESKFQVIPRGAMIMYYSDCFVEEGGVDVVIKKDIVSARIDELTVPLADVADNFRALTQEFILQKFPICQVKWMGFMQFCKGQPKDRSLNDIDLSFKIESKSDATTSFTHNDGKSYYSFTVKKNQITLTSQALNGGTYLASTTYHLKNDAGKWLIIGEEGITYTPKETHPYAAYKTPISFLGDNKIIQKKEKLSHSCFNEIHIWTSTDNYEKYYSHYFGKNYRDDEPEFWSFVNWPGKSFGKQIEKIDEIRTGWGGDKEYLSIGAKLSDCEDKPLLYDITNEGKSELVAEVIAEIDISHKDKFLPNFKGEVDRLMIVNLYTDYCYQCHQQGADIYQNETMIYGIVKFNDEKFIIPLKPTHIDTAKKFKASQNIDDIAPKVL